MHTSQTLERVILVSTHEEYAALSLLALVGGQSGIYPLVADSPDLMLRRLTRWRQDVPYQTFTQSGIMAEAARVLAHLGLGEGLSWDAVCPEDLYAALMRRMGRKAEGGHWVVAFREEPWSALLAAFRAAFDGRPFAVFSGLHDHANGLALLGERSAEIQSVHVVTENLTSDRMTWVHEQVSALRRKHLHMPFPDRVPLGFLHAKSFALMTFVDLKQRFPTAVMGRNLVATPTVERPAPADDRGVLIMTRPTASVTELQKQSVELCSLTAHGRSDLVFIGQDFLCGRSDGAEPSCLSGQDRMPACMHPPFQCFRTDGERMPINELAARHIFVNSCGSLGVANSEFGESFNLSSAALEGRAESYVGTLRWKDGDVSESFLFCYAMMAGCTLGEATVLVNAALRYNRFEQTDDVFMLLGDPKAAVPGWDVPPVPAVVTGTRVTLVLSGPYQPLFFAAPDLVRACREGSLSVSVKAGSELFCTACPASGPEGEGLLVLLMAPFAEALPLQCEIECVLRNPAFERAVSAYQHVAEQHDQILGTRKFYPLQVYKGIRNDMDNRIAGLAATYKAAFVNPNLMEKVTRQSVDLLRRVEQADKLTCLHLQDLFSRTNFRFSEHYQTTFLLDDQQPMQRCYMCGQPVLIRSQRHIIRPAVRRDEHICMQCGGIEDKPDDDFRLEIAGGDAVLGQGPAVVALTVINLTDLEQRGFGCVAVRNSARWDLQVLSACEEYQIPPRGRVTRSFSLLPGQAPPHKHAMQAAFVNQQRVYLAMRPFWVKVPTE